MDLRGCCARLACPLPAAPVPRGGAFCSPEAAVHCSSWSHRANSASCDPEACVRLTLRCNHPKCPHAGCERKAFNGDVRALVEAEYGRDPFDLQLETKVYILEKVRLLTLPNRFDLYFVFLYYEPIHPLWSLPSKPCWALSAVTM